MLEKFLKNKFVPRVIQLFFLVLFLLLTVILFKGSINFLNIKITNNLVMLLIWTLWWPLLYLTLFFVARAWCGFACPIVLANEAGNYVRKSKMKINFVKWSFLAYVIFFIVVFFEQISGLFVSVDTTLTFLGGFFLFAFFVGIILPRFSFCRLFCPIGTLLGLFSRISIIGVRTDIKKCQKCKTKECIKGGIKPACPMFNYVPTISTNKYCLICTNCIKNCPHNSSKLNFISPGKDIKEKIGFNLSESLFIIALIGFVVLITSKGTELFRIVEMGFGINVQGFLLRAFDFVFAIGIFLILYFIISIITALIGKMSYIETLKNFSYYYIPLLFFILSFTIIFGFLGPYLRFSDEIIAITKYILLIIGFVWSLVLLYKNSKKTFLPHFVFITAIMLTWIFVLIPGPLNIMREKEVIIRIETNQTLDMKAFSMGYNPKAIIVKNGTIVTLNIINIDINHAFDINEFHIHNIIEGGKNSTIMFTADKVGTFEYYCSIPGHKEAGMKGKIIVEV